MKKQLLATAIAGLFVVPAVAQVTISGNLDATATRSNKVSTTSATNAANSSNTTNTGGGGGVAAGGVVTPTNGWSTSEIVFVATEDLGGGLKATARLSQAIAGGLTQRDQVVDVSGGFGTVRLGRFTPAIGGLNAYTGAATTSQAGSLEHMSSGAGQVFGSSTATAATALFATGVAGSADFTKQAGLIQFSSPSFNGFTVNAAYGSNQLKTEAATALVEGKVQSFGVAYTNGPLKVEFASGERKAKTAAIAGTQARAFFTNGTHNSTQLQAAGATQAVTVGTAVTLGTLGLVDETGTVGLTTIRGPAGAITAGAPGVVTVAGTAAQNELNATHDFDWLGASYNLGPATLMASHSRRKTSTNLVNTTVQATTVDAKVNSVGLMVPMGATTFRLSGYTGKDERGALAADDVKLSGHQVSATYSLSKRTFIYAVMGEGAIKREASTSTALERKEKTNALGLNHSF